jgi:hypothetical protein
MIWIEYVKKYLGAFAAKDLEILDEILSDRVQLKDWAIDLVGKEEVLNANRAFFEDSGQLSVHIQNTAYHDKYICVEFVLIIRPKDETQDNTVINVVDVIEIDDYGKIKSIRAYRQ